MPLFFFLSGSASKFSLESRTASQYVKERLQRLFIPFLFGTLVLVPPQVYVHLLQASGYQATYLRFYPQFFNGIRPAGNFEWAHLWFIVYLLVFSLAALPMFLWLRQAARQRWCAELALRLKQSQTLLCFALPLIVIEALLRARWIGFQNLYDDWANVCLYFTYFVYGYLFSTNRQLEQWIDRPPSWVIQAAIVGMSILLGLWITHAVPRQGYSPAYVIYQAFRGFNAWCWVVTLLSLARSYLNFSNRLLRYLNEASYPLYILHQSIVVILGFYVVQWQMGIPQKFLLISTGGVGVTIGLYELIVRRFNLIRVCFGLKPLPALPSIAQPNQT
jgi:glucans biosynthesis protein C